MDSHGHRRASIALSRPNAADDSISAPVAACWTVGRNFYNRRRDQRGVFDMRNWRQRAALLAGTGLTAWVACAAADERVRETRNIEEPFSQVRLAGNFDLELTQSDAISLVIEAAPEDLPNIRSDVDKGVLTVRRVDDGALNFFGWFSATALRRRAYCCRPERSIGSRWMRRPHPRRALDV